MADISNVVFAAALAWQGAVDIAEGRGERGAWQQNESRYDYVDDPAVALDERGEAAVAWADQGEKDIFFNGVNVSRSPATFSWLPRIARAGERVLVLWQEIVFSGGSHGGDILFARSEDGGKTFSAPLNLSDSLAGDGKGRITKDLWHNGSLDLALGPGGSVYTAWTEYEGALWFRRSTDGGKTFSGRRKISPVGGAARGPSLAVAGGTLHLAWTDGDIRIATSTDGGESFDAPVRVTRSRAYSDAPKIALDARGVLHLVFAEGGRIRYATSADGARSFQQARHISKPRAGFPSLGVDGKTGVYVVYELFPHGQQRPRGLGIAVSRDGGRTFSAPETVPGSTAPGGAPNGSFQGLLMQKLAVNRRGEVAVVNSSVQDGARSRVWLMRSAP
ncbi:MAG: sialidase family protein [Burkholderiales bacterium]